MLTFARDLALAVWLGGLLIIDLVETPARFRVRAIDRNQVVAVGREVFAAFNRAEAVVGAALVGAETASRGSLAALAAVVVMWLVALAQYFWARPRMSAATEGLDLVNRQPEDARFLVLRRWHKIYVALDFVKAALGLTAFGMWV
jgi:uncharacterized membrane protein